MSCNNYFRCDYNGCNRIFFQLALFNRHKLTHSKPFKCTFNPKVCQKSFGRDAERKIHERIHFLSKYDECKFCRKRFNDPSNYRKHIKLKHGNNNGVILKPFICRKCHKRFINKFCLQSHQKTHLIKTKREEFKCNHCDKIFFYKSNCNRHIKKYHSSIV